MSSPALTSAESASLDFASLTPANPRTARGVQMILDYLHDQKNDAAHHKTFVRANAGFLVATRSPLISPLSPGPAELSEGQTTEADLSDDEDALPNNTTCYVLSLDECKLPFESKTGYWFGRGDFDRFPSNGGVDVLLPPGDFENRTTATSSLANSVAARHGYFAFDPKHGRFWLYARHKGIRVDDRPMARGSKLLLKRRMRVSFGPLRFIFEYKVSNEAEFQLALRLHVATTYGQQYLNEVTSATPSSNDVHIDDWILHGIVGSSPTSVIHAASNIRSGEVVAVKRLRFGSSRKKAESEVTLYDDILESIRDKKYKDFVMQKRGVLETQSYGSTNEVYLLWTPLARMGDFSQLGVNGMWSETSLAIKEVLFVQVILGLSALHDAGWIHRDLKPYNLGIVELGETPMAVIIDEGCACRRKRAGCEPRIGTCGTIGYLAPELENAAVAPCYDAKVDIWSLGAAAYFIFMGRGIPWSLRFNMFVPSLNILDPTLHVFREERAGLLLYPKVTLQNLIGTMLEEDPRKRPDIQSILAHPALRGVRNVVDARLEATKSTGQKRSQDVLL